MRAGAMWCFCTAKARRFNFPQKYVTSMGIVANHENNPQNGVLKTCSGSLDPGQRKIPAGSMSEQGSNVEIGD